MAREPGSLRASRRGRWLLLHFRLARGYARPVGRARGPDRTGGFREAGIGEGAHADEDQVRPPLSVAEERRAALGAELPVHAVAAVGYADPVGRLPGHLECCRAEAGIDRSAARA